jgi:hypothetical protein
MSPIHGPLTTRPFFLILGVLVLGLGFESRGFGQEEQAPPVPFPVLRTPLVRSLDLNIGEESRVELSDGTEAVVTLLDVEEIRDPIRQAVRKALVTIEINGDRLQLESGLYNLPMKVAGVQVDCPVTLGYLDRAHEDAWGLEKDARLRLWPEDSPWIAPKTFGYPVKQRWFASLTWFDNEPVDGGDTISKERIYYHSGCDIGGTEGMVEVVAATDALVVSKGLEVLEGHSEETPVRCLVLARRSRLVLSLFPLREHRGRHRPWPGFETRGSAGPDR